MLETFFTRSCTIHGLREGPLAGHIDLLADHLAAHGFSRVHSRIQLHLVGHFNRWLERKGISEEQLDEKVIERYCRWLTYGHDSVLLETRRLLLEHGGFA